MQSFPYWIYFSTLVEYSTLSLINEWASKCGWSDAREHTLTFTSCTQMFHCLPRPYAYTSDKYANSTTILSTIRKQRKKTLFTIESESYLNESWIFFILKKKHRTRFVGRIFRDGEIQLDDDNITNFLRIAHILQWCRCIFCACFFYSAIIYTRYILVIWLMSRINMIQNVPYLLYWWFKWLHSCPNVPYLLSICAIFTI